MIDISFFGYCKGINAMMNPKPYDLNKEDQTVWVN